MKKAILFLFLILSETLLMNSQEIILASFNGTVQIKVSENANWTQPKAGQKLTANNYIFTGFNSSAILQTGSAKIEVKPLSQVAVSTLLSDSKSIVTDVHLKYGQLKATVEKSSGKQVLFKVRSANSTASVRGTIFTLSDEELFVEEGTVYLLNNRIQDSLLVQKNERAHISKADILKDPYETRVSGYFVSGNPVGMSKEEQSNPRGRALGRIGSASSKAEVIIIIKIID